MDGKLKKSEHDVANGCKPVKIGASESASEKSSGGLLVDSFWFFSS
jgi:hypothetical protein